MYSMKGGGGGEVCDQCKHMCIKKREATKMLFCTNDILKSNFGCRLSMLFIDFQRFISLA